MRLIEVSHRRSKATIAAPKNAAQKPAESKSDAIVCAVASVDVTAGLSS